MTQKLTEPNFNTINSRFVNFSWQADTDCLPSIVEPNHTSAGRTMEQFQRVNINDECLIAYVRNYPVLYDKSHSLYFKTGYRDKVFRHVAQQLGTDGKCTWTRPPKEKCAPWFKSAHLGLKYTFVPKCCEINNDGIYNLIHAQLCTKVIGLI